MATIVRKLTPQELKALDPKQFAFKLTVELGPGFSNGKLAFSHKELAEALEKAADCRKKSPLAPMFRHLAEHITFEASHAPDRDRFLQASAPIILNDVYYGCDSCGQGYCVCNDTCEECC